jgi:hypothetical protein
MGDFDESLSRWRTRVREFSITVLIWGPGRSDPGYRVRVKIRQILQRTFKKADVRFSEDDRFLQDNWLSQLPLQDQELWHLAAADVGIVLDTAKGAGEEIAHAARYPQLAQKLFVCTPRKYKGRSSFPSAIRSQLRQVFYDDRDGHKALLDQVIAHVAHVAFLKMLWNFPHF